MSQYYPAGKASSFPPLTRGISAREYDLVKREMEALGMFKGWHQDFESPGHYRPDFNRDHPFEGRT
jgi:putative pyruvate formate lyase activating enzyme